MKRALRFLYFSVACFAAIGSASAALLERGPLMVYDDVLNITWLRDFNYAKTTGYDADGLMTWSAANTWAASLSVGGFNDWRLPTFDPNNPRPSILTSKNEFGSLWMQLQVGMSINTDTDISPFRNLPLQSEPYTQAREWYWTGLANSSDAAKAWRISMQCACWDSPLKTVQFHAMAVRDGDAGAQGLKSLTLSQSVVSGCKSVTGEVTLSRPAPAGGLVVRLSDTLASATTPATISIPQGATSRTFTVTTVPVAGSRSGTVTASLDGTTLSRNLTVRPMGVSAVTLTPTTVVGSKPVAGKATLECKAGPGPVTVNLVSSNAAVAKPIATSIVVSQSLQSATFDVTTNRVLSKSTVAISGTANGIKESTVLTVTPAAAVSPTSLKFANQKVGTTSAPLNVTLSNKGAIAFTVTSIGITGTNASSFTKSSTCPSTLSAGASCVIGVRFKPTATGSKTAKVTIATSATSTPLSVSLSGTAVSP